MRTEALTLAGQGVRVFPLGSDKKPRAANGFHDATTDVKQIKAWNWKDGLIGAAIDDGTFVVDIDPRNGGDKTVKALLKAGLKFPATRVHSTRSGGTHRFYRLPDELVGRKLKGTLGPGIDVKAAGKGYVVFPPTPGYEVQFDTEPAIAPQWMLDELVRPEPGENAGSASHAKFFEQFEEGTAYGKKAMESEIGRLLTTEEGGRNNALNKAAFALAQLVAGGEVSEDEVRSRLALAGERIGLEEEEVATTIESGLSAGFAEPRQAPPSEHQREVPVQPKNVFSPPPKEDGTFWLDWENASTEQPPFYLHPVVPKNAYVLVYGATEASKSMVWVALACEASHHGIRSSVYSLENPSHIDVHRVQRLGPVPEFFRITNEHLDLNDAAQVHALADREKEFGTDWLVIDTYSHAFSSRTEDGNAKAIEFARRIRWLMHEVGCTVVLVDHTGYADHGEPRDASAKRQQVDVAVKMDKDQPWEPGKPATFFMENFKASRFGNPFRFRGTITDVKPDGGLKVELKPLDGTKHLRWEADDV